ncbi:MAG: hypothetical protein SFX73_38670 [Kofleriaceae bacterium]|nr:hypothetical protein [Kofleriaceae bacterium]
MNDPVVLFAGLGLLALLVVPFKFPRVGMALGLLIAVAGGTIYLVPNTDPFWGDMFTELSRAIGRGTLLYASLWLAVGGYRWFATRSADAVANA